MGPNITEGLLACPILARSPCLKAASPGQGFSKAQGLNCCLWLSAGQFNWMSVIKNRWGTLGPLQSCCGRHILSTDCPLGTWSRERSCSFVLHVPVSKTHEWFRRKSASSSSHVNVNYISYLMSHSFQINSVFHYSDTYCWASNKLDVTFLWCTAVLAL